MVLRRRSGFLNYQKCQSLEHTNKQYNTRPEDKFFLRKSCTQVGFKPTPFFHVKKFTVGPDKPAMYTLGWVHTCCILLSEIHFDTLTCTCAHIQVQKPALKWEIAIISELHNRLHASDLMFGVRILVTHITVGMTMG